MLNNNNKTRKERLLTLGSLFAGIGGFELAGITAGIEPIWSNEIDSFCCKVLRKNFTNEIIEADIRQITADTTNAGIKGLREWQNETNDKKRNIKLRPVDILTGGFPCQPFSHAGKRKGKDDNRYFWPEYYRLIRELQPPWIVAENVTGLVSMENGRTLEGILSDLENENYQTEIYNIPACGVGAWHKRERIWIVAHKFGKSGRQETQKGMEMDGELLEGSKWQKNSNGSQSLCSNVPDTPGIGMEGRGADRKQKPQTQIRQKLPGCNSSGNGGNYREIEPGLGNLVYGLPSGLAGSWDREPDIPRVSKGSKDRVNKLKGLGNAIVPQIAFQFFSAINEFEKTKWKS